ncbi:MAG: hypothetical protein L6R40_007785 [Gallowayella cf. fulva]|nr:MAG: hypothetical protein L6R40_007785 [Xanthomendoza cf. fulva]
MENTAASPSDPPIWRRASTAFARIWATTRSTPPSESLHSKLPPISSDRLRASLQERSLPGSLPPDPEALKNASNKDQTYLYLAYGSNLAASTFQGVRGVRPLAALNVVVPDLVMTFDLPGLPYSEPCFANTAFRTTSIPSPTTPPRQQLQPHATPSNEKTPLLPTYSNPHWNKDMVGVVYEVTPTDYAHIIATEGGGASYHDILIPCYPLDPASTTVPTHPQTPSFKAHTLYSPISPPGSPPPKDGGRFSRPDPEYAQPSQRYINLITTGAEEHGLPHEYREYLGRLQPYTITTQGQRIGRFVLMVTCLPIIRLLFMLSGKFSDEKGRSPKWLVRLLGFVFAGIWTVYDGCMKGVLGDGERTIGDGDVGRKRKRLVKRRKDGGGVGEKEGGWGRRRRGGWVDGAHTHTHPIPPAIKYNKTSHKAPPPSPSPHFHSPPPPPAPHSHSHPPVAVAAAHPHPPPHFPQGLL